MAVRWLCLLLLASLSAAQPDFTRLSKQALSNVDSNPAEAVKLFKEGLATHPNWAEGWLYMGSCLFKMGRFAEAREALKRGSQLEPNKGTPLAFLGMAEYELGDFQPALADILKGESIGLANNPQFVAAVHYRAALIELNRSAFVMAMKQLTPLAAAGNDSPDVIEALGLTVLKIKGQPGKLEESQRALVDAAGKAAWAYEAQRSEEADKLFPQLAQQFPYSPGVHYLYGVYLIEKDRAGAEKEFRQELALSPGNADAHGQLALLLLKDGEVAEGLKQAEEAAKLEPSDAWCQATLGRALLQSGDLKGSIAALEESTKLAPDSSLGHFYLVRAYERAGNLPAAKREAAEWKRLHAKEEPDPITSQ